MITAEAKAIAREPRAGGARRKLEEPMRERSVTISRGK
jgi:hypothetical protein